MSADLNDFLGIDFPAPEAARDWADENADLTPAQRRRVDAWIKGWESELGQGHVEHLNKFSETIGNEYTALVEALEVDCREAAQIPQDLKRGRLTAKEATKKLAQLARNRDSYLKRLEAISDGVGRWEAAADAGPTARLREMQERFKTGAPRYGMRSLTADVLRGENR